MRLCCSEELTRILSYAREEALRTGHRAMGADHLVLGCTHFPHLKPVIERVCGGMAEVIDPSEAVARQAKRVLAARGLLAR